MFNYDPASHRDRLKQDGFALLRGVLSEKFVRDLTGFYEHARATDLDSDKWRIAGKKRQWVFDFPSQRDAQAFRAGMADLTGIPRDRFTISERHIKLYEDDADPYPAPHKDRAASAFSIGLPISLAEESTVCLFPELDPGPNTDNRATFLEIEGATSQAIYASPAARKLNETVGDMVIFLGSSLYHERIRAAGTAILYIKINGEGDDPLGENVYSERQVDFA